MVILQFVTSTTTVLTLLIVISCALVSTIRIITYLFCLSPQERLSASVSHCPWICVSVCHICWSVGPMPRPCALGLSCPVCPGPFSGSHGHMGLPACPAALGTCIPMATYLSAACGLMLHICFRVSVCRPTWFHKSCIRVSASMCVLSVSRSVPHVMCPYPCIGIYDHMSSCSDIYVSLISLI